MGFQTLNVEFELDAQRAMKVGFVILLFSPRRVSIVVHTEQQKQKQNS